MSGRRGRGGGHGGEHNDERWLLTYSDMITLLLALFIVLWSISSVNISKFAALKASLHQALNGKVISGSSALLTGGPQVLQPNGTPVSNPMATAAQSPIVNLRQQLQASISQAAAKQELESLRKVKEQVDAYAKSHGLAGEIHTAIDERGLVIRVLTDDVLFASGRAALEPAAVPLLAQMSKLLDTLHNPVRVEGNTDDQPIATAQFHSNWDLSAARATAVVDHLIADGVSAKRLSLAGYADQRPVASNATAKGRSLNRRVDLVVLRTHSNGA
jgi:chemotaxis protein MotB